MVTRRADQPDRSANRRLLIRRGLRLEYVTLGWNVVGSVVLLLAALATGSLAFAGFGVDSLIEIVASLVVVWQLRAAADRRRERVALRVIAVAFGLLALYIGVQALAALASATHAGRSTAGLAWLALTVCVMLGLAAGKRDTGRRLDNAVLTAEARVTLIDAALAAVVLAGVGLDTAAGWWWADPATAVAILVYACREAHHAWLEANATTPVRGPATPPPSRPPPSEPPPSESGQITSP
jgi:divalent metal cation (Fe/Co/Zn/Cd) transporter